MRCNCEDTAPVVVEVPDHLLQTSLSYALMHSEDETTDDILDRAQQFYKFLTSVKVPNPYY